jgi:acyl carrier protein
MKPAIAYSALCFMWESKMTPTEEKLVAILPRGFTMQVSPDKPITPATPIFGQHGLGLDSVDALEIAVLLDKHFGVALEGTDAEVHEALASIAALAAFVDKHQAAH